MKATEQIRERRKDRSRAHSAQEAEEIKCFHESQSTKQEHHALHFQTDQRDSLAALPPPSAPLSDTRDFTGSSLTGQALLIVPGDRANPGVGGH
ncbi:hypothetical protein J4Q44_G00144310 [Coregonus suidteri]|uniref:Uncharacterized protein n=1 Tax=Coregonus suidteri TaxID=861788 RepID=A0AAN8R631_9TELE